MRVPVLGLKHTKVSPVFHAADCNIALSQVIMIAFSM